MRRAAKAGLKLPMGAADGHTRLLLEKAETKEGLELYSPLFLF